MSLLQKYLWHKSIILTIPSFYFIMQVLQVSARDQDSAPNNLVTYGFREGNVVDGEVVFKINSTSGEITCLKKLDREVRDRYELIVYASDSGKFVIHNFQIQVSFWLLVLRFVEV